MHGLLVVLSTPVHFRLHAFWAFVSSSDFSLCRAKSTLFRTWKDKENGKVSLPLIKRHHIVEVKLLIGSGAKLPGFARGSVMYQWYTWATYLLFQFLSSLTCKVSGHCEDPRVSWIACSERCPGVAVVIVRLLFSPLLLLQHWCHLLVTISTSHCLSFLPL